MRIGFDVSICAFNNAGSARHASWLLRALQQEAPAHGAEVVPLRLPKHIARVEPSMQRKAVVLFWEFVYAPRLLGLLANVQRCDLIHTPGLIPIPRLQLPIVATVHDLLPVLYPQYFTRTMGVRTRRWLKLALRNADHIIASSNHTARDVSRVPSIRGEVSVVYPGSFLEVARHDQTDHRSSGNKHILAVGTLEPRKNLLGVVRAYRALLDTGTAPPLLIVGPQGWMSSDLMTEIMRLGLAEHVHTTGYVSDSTLATLYREAALLVYPSFYEGFGFPPLEAMSSGCPVITSAVSSLPEVVGDAGLLIDPHNTQQLASAMRLILDQPELARCLRARGYNQARRFSWQRCAQETYAVYRRTL